MYPGVFNIRQGEFMKNNLQRLICGYIVVLVMLAATTMARTRVSTVQNGDTAPPVIGTVAISDVYRQRVTVNWKTNEPANSIVEYGKTTSYGSTKRNTSLVYNHSVILRYLTPGTLYHFRVKSKDAAGNMSISQDFTFTTLGDGSVDNKPPAVTVAANPTSGQAPLTVNFSAQASDTDGSIASYQWSFGDGKSGSGATTSNTYQSVGSYTAKVTVTDNKGATASASVVISVSSSTLPPTVGLSSLSLNPTSVAGGSSLQGTVTLTGAAPSGGVVVALLGGSLAAVPGSLTVPAGASSAAFTVATQSVTTTTSAVISATYNGTTRSATLTITAPAAPPPASGRVLYVSPSGSDSNSGSQTSPFRTIQKAADVVLPGDTVIVEDGVYTMGTSNSYCSNATAVVCLTRGGTASNWVTFKARNRWGAKIDGQNNRVQNGFRFASSSASYIRIEGFDVFGAGNNGSASGFEIYSGPHDIKIIGNNIHDIGRLCTDTSNGNVGIYINGTGSVNVLVENNVIHDIGRFGPGENGCSPSNQHWQNHDHGVYHSKGDDVTVQNNIFYNMRRGWCIQTYPYTKARARYLHNVFSGPNPNKQGHIIISSGGMSDSEISNNIFYQPKDAPLWIDTSNFTNTRVSNNLTTVGSMIYNVQASGLILSNNYLSVDPKFINPSGNDFHLQSGSMAIDRGTATSVTLDMEGRPRPQGGGYDIGAYEYPAVSQLSLAAGLQSLTVSPTNVTGGGSSQGAVTLTGAAPAGGVVVTLAGSSIATAPTSVTVPAGANSATFTITTRPVASPTTVVISATAGGVTKSASLLVNPGTP
jgi:PKD repeat protein